MIGQTINQLGLGDAAELSRTAKPEAIAKFVESVGDTNPIHTDPTFAAATRFSKPIVPGIWTAGLVSAIIGTRLPGPGTIYASQELHFLRPVYLGERITARVEVVEILRERNRVRLQTTCRNRRGEEVLSGEAWVLPSKVPIRYRKPRNPTPGVRPL